MRMKTLLLSALGVLYAAGVTAKDIKTLTVTTQPQMHCENCEKKIKGNLRFEKGVKKIETSVEKQQVVITYDADKTQPDAIIKSFGKFGYKATEQRSEQDSGQGRGQNKEQHKEQNKEKHKEQNKK